MITEKITKIAEWVQGNVVGDADLVIQGVSTDSRKIAPGQLFIPLMGPSFDGHTFADQVVHSGVRAMFWQADHPLPEDLPMPCTFVLVEDTLTALQTLAKSYRDTLSVLVVGVTGSNGKTSTKDLVTTLLSTKFKVQKTEGNLNNHIGLPLMLLRLEHDTEIAVLEMGMSAKGEIALLASLARPSYGIITNIGEAHIEYLGSREGIAEAKFELIDHLPANGHAFLYGDEPLLRELAERSRVSVTWFGLQSGQNSIYPVSLETHGLSGSDFTIPDSPVTFHLPVPGTHQVTNALAALAVARKLGCSDEQCKDALSQAQLSAMRMQIQPGLSAGSIINDAYNASPTSMRAALAMLKSLEADGFVVAVLGDMLELGDSSAAYHYEVGQYAAQARLDLLVAVGNFADEILRGARDQGMKPEWMQSFADSETAAVWLEDHLARSYQPVVLVKGSRGMRMEKIVQRLTSQEA